MASTSASFVATTSAITGQATAAATPAPSQPATDAGQKTDTGVIVGAVIGSVLGIMALIFGVWRLWQLLWSWKHESPPPSTHQDSAKHDLEAAVESTRQSAPVTEDFADTDRIDGGGGGPSDGLSEIGDAHRLSAEAPSRRSEPAETAVNFEGKPTT
jgi:hypothetical protein